MGTETNKLKHGIEIYYLIVKLNNPLMGTETAPCTLNNITCVNS